MKTIFIFIVGPALFTASFLLPQAALAQKHPAAGSSLPGSAYRLVAVKVAGTTRYADQEILAASGLELQQKAGDEDFKAAVRRLGDSGMFADAAYSFTYSTAGTKLELHLTDADEKKLVPTHFENFVWFTDGDLASELRRRVPLFKGSLPVTGNLIEHVSEALQTILDEKQIPGRVDYLREAKQDSEDLIGVAYKVVDLEIRIRNVDFPGATPDQGAWLTRAARKLRGAEYFRSALAAVAQLDFLPIYEERGYLKASFGPTEARVVAPEAAPAEAEKPDDRSADRSEVQVDAIFPVAPGKVYSTSEVVWKGNAVFSAERLQSLLHMPAAQPANAIRLASDLETVTKLYRTNGYMTARIVQQPVLDEEHSTVRYTLSVKEGEQFKMGELELLGLDARSQARLQEAWNLREGDPYNADYPKTFVEQNLRLLAKGTRWGVATHEAINEKDKTVDVTIRFTAN